MEIIRNDPNGFEVPSKADGSLYRYEVLPFGAQKRGYFDSPEEIAEWIIPQYSKNKSTSENLTALIEHAFFVQTHLQAHINLDLQEEISALDAEAQDILDAPRGPDFAISTWRHEIPILLVDVCYKPFTDKLPPSSASDNIHSIYWLRPAAGIGEYLISLDEVGFITLAHSLEAGA